MWQQENLYIGWIFGVPLILWMPLFSFSLNFCVTLPTEINNVRDSLDLGSSGSGHFIKKAGVEIQKLLCHWDVRIFPC